MFNYFCNRVPTLSDLDEGASPYFMKNIYPNLRCTRFSVISFRMQGSYMLIL